MDALELLGDILGNLISGHRAKSKTKRLIEYAVTAIVVLLMALLIYRIYFS